METAITPTEAAKILGVTPAHVRFLISEGRLRAKKFGSVWVVKRADLKRVRRRKPGRPKNGGKK